MIVAGSVQLSYKYYKAKKAYEYYLGKEVVVGLDTLTITDYNIIPHHNFTVSNGRKIDATIIDNFLINE